MKENELKFFRPLWIRVLVTGILVVWCELEIALSHDQVWIGITGFGVAYSVWNLFLKFPKTFAETPAAVTVPAEPAALVPSDPEPPKQP
jgi:hypothetical protein